MNARVLLLVFALALCAGCVPVRHASDRLTDPELVATHEATAEHFRRRAELTELLSALGPGVDAGEAARVAEVALTYPYRLAQQYKLTKPALMHNGLVNAGIKPRGLCTHWTEDILERLARMELQSFDLYWGVANPQRAFRIQHSTPVVTARGAPFESGVVLDAWRDSGELHYAPVLQDGRFLWEEHYKIRDQHSVVVSPRR